MTSYINRLKKELASLKQEREFALMADDFAVTNGSLKTIDRHIWHLESLIADELGKLKEAA